MAAEAKASDGERAAMKWVWRGMWAAAWGTWLWLGFGLYRELPRDFPLVCDLSLPPNSIVCGFLGDTHEVVFHERGASPQDGSHLYCVDAANATLLRTTKFGGEASLLESTFATLRDGVILENVHYRTDDWKQMGFHALDVVRGSRRRISVDGVNNVVVHEANSWIAFNRPGLVEAIERVVVYDYKAMKEVFARIPSSTETLVGSPLFVPGSSKLLIAYQTFSSQQTDWPKGRIEIWDLAGEPVLVRTVRGSIGFDPTVSTNDRVAFRELAGGPATIDVIDLQVEKRVFVHPPRDERLDLPLLPVRAVVSRDGTKVFGGESLSVFDMQTEGVIWPRCQHESVFEFNPQGNVTLLENWRTWSGLPLPKSWNLTTLTLRKLDDGTFVRRTWHLPFLKSTAFSRDGRFAVDVADGRVYASRPLVNYPLLALCQTFLALPLVLLWALLRWRRRRRMTGVTP
jgi:hypothetical protein